MTEQVAVKCPNCRAVLKLKNRSSVGKRVPCPKCKTPFVVESAEDLEGNDLEFLKVTEPDADPERETDEISKLPPTTGRTKKKPPAKPPWRMNWLKPVLFVAVAMLVVGLVVVGGYFGGALLDRAVSGNPIDVAWLPPDADVIIRLRPAEMWGSPFVSSLSTPKGVSLPSARDLIGLDPKEVRTMTIGGVGLLDAAEPKPGGGIGLGAFPGMPALGAAQPRMIAVLRTVEKFDRKQMESKLQGTRQMLYKKEELNFAAGVAGAGKAFFFPDSSTIVMGPEAEVKAAIDRGHLARPRPDLAFVDRDRHVLIVLAPTDRSYFDSKRPGALGGQALEPLEQALAGKVRGLCLGFHFKDNIDWAVDADCNSATAAGEAAAGLDKALAEGKTQIGRFRASAPPMLSELVIALENVLNSITCETRGGVVATRGQIPASIKNLADSLPQLMLAGMTGGGLPAGGLATQGGGPFNSQSLSGPGAVGAVPADSGQQPSPDQASADSTATQEQIAACKQQLEQIGRALFSCAEVNGNHFPDAAIRGKAGKPLLSWRVAILPYLDQQELYNEFHLDEPWDSEHNQPLIERMPAVFACPGANHPGSTSYLAAQGPGAMFEGGRGRGLADVTDGTSFTVLLVEVDDSLAVPWTKPEDYTYDPAAPLLGLLSPHGEGFCILAADGAAYYLKHPFAPQSMSALFTRSGGETIPPGTLK